MAQEKLQPAPHGRSQERKKLIIMIRNEMQQQAKDAQQIEMDTLQTQAKLNCNHALGMQMIQEMMEKEGPWTTEKAKRCKELLAEMKVECIEMKAITDRRMATIEKMMIQRELYLNEPDTPTK